MSKKHVNKHKTVDKTTYSYYKTAFRANKRYRDKKGLSSPTMLSKDDWEYHKNQGIDNQEIVYTQFHKFNKKSTSSLKKEFKKAGKTITNEQLYTGDIDWSVISNEYYELKKAESSTQAKKDISHRFFGSD